MGSARSGRYGRRSLRGTVEQTRYLTLADLIDAGVVRLTSDDVWNGSASFILEPSGDVWTLGLCVSAAPQPTGGVRWYLHCPCCGRRCTALYLPRGANQYACRKCSQLDYRTQRIGRRARSAYKAFKLLRRIGVTSRGIVPPKPKGMHRTTYIRLLDAVDKCQQPR